MPPNPACPASFGCIRVAVDRQRGGHQGVLIARMKAVVAAQQALAHSQRE
jgi:hypothetical protein